MKMKFTFSTFLFILFFCFFSNAQIKVNYFRCDNPDKVPANKPITIVYPSEIMDTSGLDLYSINLNKNILFTAEGNEVYFSAFYENPNQITIIPHNDLLSGKNYTITIKPFKYKESKDLTEEFQCQFHVDKYAKEQTVETAYLNSFNYLIENFSRRLYPTDTLKKLEAYLLPENLSYLKLEHNQAARMRAVAPIFDAMARNPKIQEEILLQSINSLGSIDEMETLSPEAEAERMISLAYLFKATSRQPEIADTLNLLADTLLGVPDNFSVLSDQAKVYRMRSLSMIFDAIARQPEVFRTILNQGLRYNGAIHLLGNTTPEAEAERMLAFRSLFEAISRQPIALDSLIIATDTLLGIPDNFSQFDDKVIAARMQALSGIFTNAARQPEMADTMLQQAVKYMGRFKELNPLDSLSESYRMRSIAYLWDAMARQPEASEKLCSMVDTLMGIPTDFSAISNLGKEGRIMGLYRIFDAMARQPEISDSLLSKAIKYCGSSEQVGILPENTQAFQMFTFNFVFEAIARQPEIWKKIDHTADTLLGIPNDFANLTDFIHEGRVRAIEGLFNSISRQPDYCDTLFMVAKKYLGTYEQIKSIPDETRFYVIGQLVESMLHQFEYADTLDLVAESLIGVPNDFENISDEAIYMRSKSIRGFFNMYPNDQKSIDYITNILYKYIGKWSQINKENKFSEMARIEAATYLFEAIYRSPEKTSEYLEIFETVLGTTNNFTNLDSTVKIQRHQALLDFYYRYSISDNVTADSLLKTARKVLGVNNDCPVQTWTESEMRMEVLNYLFEEFNSRRGFERKEKLTNSFKHTNHFETRINVFSQNNLFEQEIQNEENNNIKDQSKIDGYGIDNESLEKLVSVIEEFSGKANIEIESNDKLNYFRQMANMNLTVYLKYNEIHDTLIADARERLLGTYTPEKPLLFGAPSNGSFDVPVDYKMHLLFTDIMYAYDSTLISTATINDSIKLITIDNKPVPFNVEVNTNNRTISIIPTEDLTHGMQYKLIVPECFINFDDSTANSIANQFKVEKAILKVIAEDKEMNEGDAIPELTMIFEGFVDDDTEETITRPEIVTEATSTSTSGVYPITLSGGSSDKYNFELVNGSLNIIETTGIDFKDNNSKVNIFPNPVSNILYFESMKEDLVLTDIEIINQQGQVVLRKHVEDTKSNIDVSKLENGLYIVLFKINNQSTIARKIMKQ